jgi:glycosyltransferase involved in cell wall biosynthesis
MNATPRLSVGLPVCNGEEYLAESIKSLPGQNFEDLELIVSDNAVVAGREGGRS